MLFATVVWLVFFSHSVQCSVDQWVIKIPGGTSDADRVADEHDCKNLGLLQGYSDVFIFEKKISFNSSDEFGDKSENSNTQLGFDSLLHRTKRELEAHSSVSWADPQVTLKRVKRGYIDQLQLVKAAKEAYQAAGKPYAASPPRSSPFNTINGSPQTRLALGGERKFNDELWMHQWYMHDTSNVAHFQSDIDLKVEDVWEMGFTGDGIVVSILDDGLEWNHTDILPNYDPRASFDMNNNRSDPFPRYDILDSNGHGTRCAGEVAMVANNGKCGVGVAPRARIGGIKCLDGKVEDKVEYFSLLHNIDYIDIFSGSWGPPDDGQTVDGPKRLAADALHRGVTEGRGGKGVLYVWANGNGGKNGDNCNCDGYVSSIYTISIGSVSQQGQIPYYGERCSSTLAVTTSSGTYTDKKVVTTDLHNKCTVDHTGTSAAAPLAAGVFALALEANRNLTWRDVQHLTVWTSDPIPLRDNPGWKRNSAGLIFNSRFGFGLINAKAMVETALNWQHVPKKSICSVAANTRLPVYLQSRNLVYVSFNSDGCQRRVPISTRPIAARSSTPARAAIGGRHQTHARERGNSGSQWSAGQQSPVVFLEHVRVIVDIEYTTRGNLDIFLISPAGTVSTLLGRRPLDITRDGFDKWPLMSVHFWGETALGKWTLIVRDKDGINNRGLLKNATLELHGTTIKPEHMSHARVYQLEDQVAPFLDPVLEFDEEDVYDLNTFPNEMSMVRDDSHPATFIKSLIAAEKLSARD